LFDTSDSDSPYKLKGLSKDAFEKWRQVISGINIDLPGIDLIKDRFHKSDYENINKSDVTWGDSIYQRAFGDGFIISNVDFDKSDFQALFALHKKCAEFDDRDAKQLYKQFGDHFAESEATTSSSLRERLRDSLQHVRQ
jgi:hypothetical protein